MRSDWSSGVARPAALWELGRDDQSALRLRLPHFTDFIRSATALRYGRLS